MEMHLSKRLSQLWVGTIKVNLRISVKDRKSYVSYLPINVPGT